MNIAQYRKLHKTPNSTQEFERFLMTKDQWPAFVEHARTVGITEKSGGTFTLDDVHAFFMDGRYNLLVLDADNTVFVMTSGRTKEQMLERVDKEWLKIKASGSIPLGMQILQPSISPPAFEF